MTVLPAEVEYGFVTGRLLQAVADTTDSGRLPDAVPMQGKIKFTPANQVLRVGEPASTIVLKQPITCQIDAEGYLMGPPFNFTGVWLVAGVYTVTYTLVGVLVKSHDIEVLPEHTDANPLDLTTAMPPGGPVLGPSEYADLNGRLTTLEIDGLPLHADTHAVGGTDPITPGSINAYNAAALDTYQQPGQSGGWTGVDLSLIDVPGRYFDQGAGPDSPEFGAGSSFMDVVTNPAGGIVIQTYSVQKNHRVYRRIRGGASAPWSAWRRIDGGGTIRGTGQPEGVVAAPVGTEYIDLDATAGARKWYKASGAGSTGWIVTEGGPVVMDASSYLLNGWAAPYAGRCEAIRRVGSVTLAMYISPKTATSDVLMHLADLGPSWQAKDIVGSWVRLDGTDHGPVLVQLEGGLYEVIAIGAAGILQNVYISLTYTPLNIDWPTSL